MKPQLWMCILVTVVLAPIVAILLFTALFGFLGGTEETILLGSIMGFAALVLLGVMIYFWVMRARVVKEERKNMY